MQENRQQTGRELWARFSETGKIGAYLAYRSARRAEQSGRETPGREV